MTPVDGLSDDPRITKRFDTICRLLAERHSGILLGELADAWRVAELMEEPDPDRSQVAFLVKRLGVDLGEL